MPKVETKSGKVKKFPYTKKGKAASKYVMSDSGMVKKKK